MEGKVQVLNKEQLEKEKSEIEEELSKVYYEAGKRILSDSRYENIPLLEESYKRIKYLEKMDKLLDAALKGEEETKICPRCGNAIRTVAKFCDQCGAELTEKDRTETEAAETPLVRWFCPSCGGEVAENSIFCKKCGENLKKYREGLKTYQENTEKFKENWQKIEFKG